MPWFLRFFLFLKTTFFLSITCSFFFFPRFHGGAFSFRNLHHEPEFGFLSPSFDPGFHFQAFDGLPLLFSMYICSRTSYSPPHSFGNPTASFFFPFPGGLPHLSEFCLISCPHQIPTSPVPVSASLPTISDYIFLFFCSPPPNSSRQRIPSVEQPRRFLSRPPPPSICFFVHALPIFSSSPRKDFFWAGVVGLKGSSFNLSLPPPLSLSPPSRRGAESPGFPLFFLTSCWRVHPPIYPPPPFVTVPCFLAVRRVPLCLSIKPHRFFTFPGPLLGWKTFFAQLFACTH